MTDNDVIQWIVEQIRTDGVDATEELVTVFEVATMKAGLLPKEHAEHAEMAAARFTESAKAARP